MTFIRNPRSILIKTFGTKENYPIKQNHISRNLWKQGVKKFIIVKLISTQIKNFLGKTTEY
jgi:hypothetical protein